MRTAQTQAAALVGMLAATTGHAPTTDETPERIRIEADLPERLSPAVRLAILTALADADQYGHERTDERDAVWAEFSKGDTQ